MRRVPVAGWGQGLPTYELCASSRRRPPTGAVVLAIGRCPASAVPSHQGIVCSPTRSRRRPTTSSLIEDIAMTSAVLILAYERLGLRRSWLPYASAQAPSKVRRLPRPSPRSLPAPQAPAKALPAPRLPPRSCRLRRPPPRSLPAPQAPTKAAPAPQAPPKVAAGPAGPRQGPAEPAGSRQGGPGSRPRLRRRRARPSIENGHRTGRAAARRPAPAWSQAASPESSGERRLVGPCPLRRAAPVRETAASEAESVWSRSSAGPRIPRRVAGGSRGGPRQRDQPVAAGQAPE